MGVAAFKVKQSALKMGSQELCQYRTALREAVVSVEEARKTLSGMHGSVRQICRSLTKIENKISHNSESVAMMAEVLTEVANLYGKAEATLTGQIKGETDSLEKFLETLVLGEISEHEAATLAVGMVSGLTAAILGTEGSSTESTVYSFGKTGARIEGDIGSAEVNAYIGKTKLDSKLEGAFMEIQKKREYKNGKWTDEDSFVVLNGEAGLEASFDAVSSDIQGEIGDDMLGAEVKAEVAAGSIDVGAKGEISIGEGGLDANVGGKAVISAVEGEASGTINIMGLEITGKATGYAGGAGVEGKFGIDDNKFVMEGGFIALIGGSIGVEIGFNETGWNNFVDFVTFWD